MRKTILILATAAAVTLGAQPVLAQEFTGPRVELNAGYDSTHVDNGGAATPNSIDAARLGGAIGYDIGIGDTLTVGAEIGAGFNVTGSAEARIGATDLTATAGHDFDASLRVGARVGSRTLVYAKGGYANSQFTLKSTTGTTTTKISDDEDGWRIGAGVEHLLTDRIYAKAEYRYTDYGHDVRRHQALVGLGYRF